MSTDVTVHRTSSFSPAEVQSRLDAQLVAEGAADVDGWLTINRSIPAPAAVAAFVSGPLTICARRRWHGTSADVEINVLGQPVQAVGTLRLTATDTGCTVDARLTITANVPFMGSMIEDAVKPEIEANIDRELAAITG